MNSGIINVYKEAGYTSFDVVARLRGILKIKKIGHTGTLDPDATGVLPVCVGKATKLCDMLTDKDKVYECVMMLGVETDTYDLSGRILERKSVNSTEEEIVGAINSFVGDIMQVPPMYSALKVNGKKLYELAREGIEVERKARPVTIFSIDILNISLPEVSIRIHCSKGTYIRSLCHDVGQKLGCGCAMKSLVRTRVSMFDISDARTLDEIERIVK
ncbi:MAG: tRNA pseudouridine(55) synthase TruB, partial [Pseudobutyrivibrio sp.]|nr:tRNA pseudouridine(55) synthase TruB [Pseudobutyrivibrio sp.]